MLLVDVPAQNIWQSLAEWRIAMLKVHYTWYSWEEGGVM
jgi:hypothetical protein